MSAVTKMELSGALPGDLSLYKKSAVSHIRFSRLHERLGILCSLLWILGNKLSLSRLVAFLKL